MPDALWHSVDPGEVFRVGFAPEPWNWSPWEYAPFSGRWDDPEPGGYRVLYVGSTPYACYVEVLAQFRPDPDVALEIAALSHDSRDVRFPTTAGGTVPLSWATPRRLGSAQLRGSYVDVQHANTIAALRPRFLSLARRLGFRDFDGGAIRVPEPRALTQAVSRFLWEHTHDDGVHFESRFGNRLTIYAVFERAATSHAGLERSALLSAERDEAVPVDSPDFLGALSLHGLTLDLSN